MISSSSYVGPAVRPMIRRRPAVRAMIARRPRCSTAHRTTAPLGGCLVSCDLGLWASRDRRVWWVGRLTKTMRSGGEETGASHDHRADSGAGVRSSRGQRGRRAIIARTAGSAHEDDEIRGRTAGASHDHRANSGAGVRSSGSQRGRRTKTTRSSGSQRGRRAIIALTAGLAHDHRANDGAVARRR